jgi:hypothetical protein
MDVDPSYVDVMLNRWAKLTGGDPVRESDGASFAELVSAAKESKDADA